MLSVAWHYLRVLSTMLFQTRNTHDLIARFLSDRQVPTTAVAEASNQLQNSGVSQHQNSNFAALDRRSYSDLLQYQDLPETALVWLCES